jgi:hypothetical protein
MDEKKNILLKNWRVVLLRTAQVSVALLFLYSCWNSAFWAFHYDLPVRGCFDILDGVATFALLTIAKTSLTQKINQC